MIVSLAKYYCSWVDRLDVNAGSSRELYDQHHKQAAAGGGSEGRLQECVRLADRAHGTTLEAFKFGIGIGNRVT